MEPLASLAGLNLLYFAGSAIGGTGAISILLTGANQLSDRSHHDLGCTGHADEARA